MCGSKLLGTSAGVGLQQVKQLFTTKAWTNDQKKPNASVGAVTDGLGTLLFALESSLEASGTELQTLRKLLTSHFSTTERGGDGGAVSGGWLLSAHSAIAQPFDAVSVRIMTQLRFNRRNHYCHNLNFSPPHFSWLCCMAKDDIGEVQRATARQVERKWWAHS
ncbi:unnamed protein product [Ceratitis capitata]|uniref:(Mediterranean fruit fly) hypothetical protein n=1 Tax=Ceratitis capitata TaxID=7213 RepID=A0A811UZR2_CERCA|nr:unnamed protein product [Ceratitis capitata]